MAWAWMLPLSLSLFLSFAFGLFDWFLDFARDRETFREWGEMRREMRGKRKRRRAEVNIIPMLFTCFIILCSCVMKLFLEMRIHSLSCKFEERRNEEDNITWRKERRGEEGRGKKRKETKRRRKRKEKREEREERREKREERCRYNLRYRPNFPNHKHQSLPRRVTKNIQSNSSPTPHSFSFHLLSCCPWCGKEREIHTIYTHNMSNQSKRTKRTKQKSTKKMSSWNWICDDYQRVNMNDVTDVPPTPLPQKNIQYTDQSQHKQHI